MAAPLWTAFRRAVCIAYHKKFLDSNLKLLVFRAQSIPNGTCFNKHRWRGLRCSSLNFYSTDSQVQQNEPDKLYEMIELEMRGHDRPVLNSYERFIQLAANELNITISNIYEPPKHIYRRTLLKSAHVHKKHRVQYEIRTHFRIVELQHLTGSTASTFLEYIQRNLPEGVSMKCTHHEVQKLADHIRPPTGETP